MAADPLTRPAASAAVVAAGWRLLLQTFAASVPVDGLRQGAAVALAVVEACGADADGHLRVDVRADRVELVLQTRATNRVTERDVELAETITGLLRSRGHEIAPPAGGRPVHALEIAIDALDIAAVRPFWLAVLGYEAEPGDEGPTGAIVDPARALPSIWFQQMDAPREQRNRIHFDIAVAHDEALGRVRAAVDAGGTLVSDEYAKSFWVLADREGNEICVCTWQDRD
jgi:4a-hydroxytetrahydrobiopterin dehydratase